jgi:hypothetical protein
MWAKNQSARIVSGMNREIMLLSIPVARRKSIPHTFIDCNAMVDRAVCDSSTHSSVQLGSALCWSQPCSSERVTHVLTLRGDSPFLSTALRRPPSHLIDY